MNPDETTRIISGFLGMAVSTEQVELLYKYFEMLREWNKRLNLIKIKGWEEFLIMHVLDSTSPLKWGLIKKSALICDMGTGGGLPGIPIKIMKPDVEALLIDSRRKKIKAVENMIKGLSLDGIDALWGRVEDVVGELGGRFDVVLARAIGNKDDVIRLALPLMKTGGDCIIYGTAEKTDNGEQQEGVYRYCFEGLNKDRVLNVLRKQKSSTWNKGLKKTR